MEARLLSLFTKTPSPHGTDAAVPRSEHAVLWRADAVHRTKNLSQMVLALATLIHRADPFFPTDVMPRARRLARAYDVLGDDEGRDTPVPCERLLKEVVLGLVGLFGDARGVSARVLTEPVKLVPAARRALILIASELTINALKYGFAGSTGGTITVELTHDDMGIHLAVDDDGAGGGDYVPGHGSGLIEGLSAILAATVIRSPGPDGRGFRVLVSTRRGN